ncbi:hypothetical protein AVEN_240814-1 [Araneus ventricosus]|uniref:Uncharacterized protein n=1 Tax=Araneus ventricosus TaxID=182803 RepID=A0A4Y2U7U6_ARAVE|nr:hypothetical protein AVEN_189960-1 [Araneus ventricosus]GBO09100.1 hypothetical protein AVEN_240814-1 [Araneus ventricosus]
MRPRWPSARVSALGPGDSKFPKSDSTEDPLCMRPVARGYIVAKCPPVGVAWKFGEGCRLGSRPRRLTAVQNYEVHPKIALVLLQNGALIKLS